MVQIWHIFMLIFFLRIAGLTSVRVLLADYILKFCFNLSKHKLSATQEIHTTVRALLTDNLFQVMF